MWWGAGQDPGGGGSEGDGTTSKEPSKNQEFHDLQEQFEQQQTLVAQLKEMLRRSETSSISTEKVEEYANTLNEINARAKLRKESKRQDAGESSGSGPSSETTSQTATIVTPATEKINLLRQQMEENRKTIAQRDKNKKGIEDMVNQLKAQLDDSQNILTQTQLNFPNMLPTTAPIFSQESSKEDLFTVIKHKDTNIQELNSKLEQLQANVLDLQENLKEKDSVIEARTKAITLLSENLSKKGKNTLDMLDETKEQMREMQQNFVLLEAKMREENFHLRVEVDDKDKRIVELEEINADLENKCSTLPELEKTIAKLNADLEENQLKLMKLNEDLPDNSSPQKLAKKSKSTKKLKGKDVLSTSDSESRIIELEKLVEELKTKQGKDNTTSSSRDEEEITKLSKQLEEMNKNMIKMKAQHKAKLKEIQKKTQPSEIGEKLTTMEAENMKLGQRIAELEEEKGNLQLRLVDFESNKEKEYIADLENKIEEQKMEIENHIRTITTLESQIVTSSNEISSLRTELANLMHIENAQVCSEMTSVQLEEQLDKEITQKKEIQNKYNELVKQNEEFQAQIDAVNKEKSELNTKLENYMQENMDLIDRLEKLSAEKVSSAESIEIVESLTQQEKLEIEAYQKNLEFNPDKPEDTADLDTSPELNESVSKLTEETSELMERIELFTVERREVMEKMDNLHAENQQLRQKLEKIEIETMQLQSENEELLCNYQSVVENYKIKTDTLAKLEEAHDLLLYTHETLKSQLKQSLEGIQEKDLIKNELNATKQNIIQLEFKLIENSQEINYLKSVIDDNNTELIQSIEKLSQKDDEIENLQHIILDLNDQVQQQADCDNFSQELSNLKTVVSEDFEQLQQYQINMKQNTDVINELNVRIEETEMLLQVKQLEVEKIEAENWKLKSELREKDELFTKTCEELKARCQVLQTQIQATTGSLDDIKGPFEAQIKDLEQKNKEQVDKMKKIAANLKKKATTCQELETNLNNTRQQLQTIQSEVVASQLSLECKMKEFDALKINHDALEAKLQEKDMFIESLELENSKYKSQIFKLEEGLSNIEERRQSLEQRALDLAVKLDEKDTEYKQVTETEDFLEQRLTALITHDEFIEQKLKTTIEENQNLLEKLKAVEKENEIVKLKLADFTEEYNNKSSARLQEVESENIRLNEIIYSLETEIKKVKLDLGKKLAEKDQELDTLETEFSTQLEVLSIERNNIQAKYQNLQETHMEEFTKKEQRLQDEIEQLKQQLSSLKLDFNKKHDENNELNLINSNHILRIEHLENQLREIEQNSNLTQELQHLRDVITQKDIDIENYQRQNMQLQMSHGEQESVTLRQQVDQLNQTIAQLNQTLVEREKLIDELKESSVQEEIIQKIVAAPALNTSIKTLSLEESKEELLKKIKALEFMLFNVEKEKDDTLIQCHEFVNELTRLVYEKEKFNKDKPQRTTQELNLDDLESSIIDISNLSETDNIATPGEIKTELHSLEYSPTVASSQEEALIHPKTTYLCFSDDPNKPGPSKPIPTVVPAQTWGSEDTKIRESIESQIITTSEITPEDKQLLQQVEYEPVQKHLVEPSAEPKQAYLCYPDGVLVEDTFASEEDGWGWNAEEAKLEAEHRQTVSVQLTAPPTQSKIDQLEDRINDLELERSRLLEEIKTSQIRSGKYIKKLKELKQKVDSLTLELNKKSSSEFDILDLAIQDELNTQIKTLEKKIKELSDESVKDKTEKEHLLKRIDVLSAANERMMELKEKQDSEMQFWQFKNRELSSKLEQFEWGADDNKSPIKPPLKLDTTESSEDLNRKILELNVIINDLTLDNEEMQCLLEEQRKIRKDAEKALLNIPKQENQILDLNTEIVKLNTEKKLLEESEKDLKILIAELKTENEKIAEDLEKLTAEKQHIEDNTKPLLEFQVLENEIKNLQNQIRFIEENSKSLEEYKILEDAIEDLNTKINKSKTQFDFDLNQIKEENYQLKHQIQTLQSNEFDLIQLKEQLKSSDNLLSEKELLNQRFESEIVQLKDQINSLKSTEFDLIQLKDQLNQSETLQSQKEAFIQSLNEQIKVLESDKLNLQNVLTEKELLVQNLNSKVQQLESERTALEIQNSNNTSDEKLQQILTELDSKNKELASLQTILNADRLEFEQKLLTTIEQLNQEWSQQVDQRGTDVAESWKLHLDSLESEFSEKEQELLDLRNKNQDLVSHIQKTTEDNSKVVQEMFQLTEKLTELQTTLDELNSEKGATDDSIELLEKTISEKEIEIINLFKQIQDSSKQNNDLQQTIDVYNTEKQFEIVELTQKLQNYEKILDLLNSEKGIKDELIKEKDLEIRELSCKLQNSLDQNTDYQETINTFTYEKQDLINNLQLLQLKNNEKDYEIQELTQKIEQLVSENSNFSDLLQKLDSTQLELESLQDELNKKQIEINNLQVELELKNTEILTIKTEKETEFSQLKTETATNSDELNAKIHDLEQQLNASVTAYNELESKLNELNSESVQIPQLRQIIESQVLNIEELKQRLYEKSNDYDAVVSEFETLHHHKKPEKHVHFETPETTEPREELSEPATRAELDLALYMLHQRDVRCEELTVELMQLLEERDTLQLRLSNAIRINEELRGKSGGSEDVVQESSRSSKLGASPRSKTSEIVLGATGTELATEATESATAAEQRKDDQDEIATKLSQLRSIGYRDKTLQDDQETRHMQQMTLMHQHRDLASKLPAEAAARLVDASYTLSRDVQSPSKVLLNWLWGRSTPKVNDI